MKLINTVKALVLAAPLVFALSAQAAGQEELCSQVAESDVRMKVLMTKDDRFFDFTLTELNSSDSANKEKLREKLFFIHNRLHLSNKEFKRLSFLRCITDTW